MSFCASDAREAVALAVRLHGFKRGWHLAATLLGVAPRTARALASGETSGATIDPLRAQQARLNLIAERLRVLRAEQAQLESALNEGMAAGVSHVGMGQ